MGSVSPSHKFFSTSPKKLRRQHSASAGAPQPWDESDRSRYTGIMAATWQHWHFLKHIGASGMPFSSSCCFRRVDCGDHRDRVCHFLRRFVAPWSVLVKLRLRPITAGRRNPLPPMSTLLDYPRIVLVVSFLSVSGALSPRCLLSEARSTVGSRPSTTLELFKPPS